MLFLNILLFLIQPYILYPLYNTLPLFCKSRSDTFSVTVHQYSGKLYELEMKSGANCNESSQWSLVDRDTVIAYFKEDLDSLRI